MWGGSIQPVNGMVLARLLFFLNYPQALLEYKAS